MKLTYWLESLFSRSGRHLRCPLRHRRQWHRSQQLAASFEILETRVLLASDFGDAPLPFPTTLAEGGAEHVITADAPRLGATVDVESDGWLNARK